MRPRDSAQISSPSVDNAVVKVLGPPTPNYAPPFRPKPPTVPPANPNAPVALVWFRGHDLRVDDHAALDAAVASGATIVALYVLECGPENQGATAYMRRYTSSFSSSDTNPTPSYHSDVVSTVTTESSVITPPNTFRQPNVSPVSLDTRQDSWGPLSPNGGFALGRVQRWYLHHSLSVLRQQLQQLGITLVLRRVNTAEDTVPVVTSVATALGAGAVFWNKRYKPCVYPIDEAVTASLRKRAIYSQDFDSESLMQSGFAHSCRYNDFQSYTRFWVDAMRVCPPPRPNSPVKKSDVKALEEATIHALLAQRDISSASIQSDANRTKVPLPSVADLQLLDGLSLQGLDSPGDVENLGCVAARRTVNSFLQQDRFARFANGPSRRDGMVTGHDLATSRLSPHLRFGEISPRVLFYKIVDAGAAAQDSGNKIGVEAARTFLKNMSLREFGYYMLARYPSAAYKPIMPEFEVFPWEEDEDGALTQAWKTGTTGFPIVDAAMRQLLREGWLHNRMRFLVASFFCKYLLLPWQVGAAHLVRTLVDGDEACNSLGWQWTVGCNSDSFPFSTLVNPLSLYTHTQSRAKAADYVRKYVPELAHLPDKLVFTPWKARAEERTQYRLNLLPLRKYKEAGQFARSYPGKVGELVYYPARVVTGKDARFRARRAMEVMRRIFAAQRQCRTIIGEQEILGACAINGRHPRLSVTETKKKKQRIVEGVHVPDANGKQTVERDISELESTVSCVSEVPNTKKSAERRRRERDESGTHPTLKKRRRVTRPSKELQGDAPRTPSRTPMMSIAQLSSPVIDPNPQRAIHLTSSSTNRDAAPGATKGRRAARLESAKNTATVVSGKSSSPRNLKRPRPTTPHIGQTSSERLSVRSLLSPSLSHGVGMSSKSPPSQHLRATRGSPMVSDSRMTIPESSHVALYQNPMSANGNLPNDLKTPDLLTNLPSRFVRGSPSLQSDVRPPATPSAQPQHVGGNRGMNVKALSHQNPNDGMVAHPSNAMLGPSPTSPFLYQGSPSHDNANVGLTVGRVSDGNSMVVGQRTTTLVPGPQAQIKREVLGPVPSFDMHRAPAPTVFHPGVSPVPLIGGHYQPSQHHNPQMMMSFRPPPNNPIQVPHLSHAAGAMPTSSVSQGYFAAAPVSAAPHQPAGQQVLWYPTLSPYVELRGPGLPGAVLPHMMHPMARQHPHGVPMGYTVPGAGAIGTQGDASRMVPQAGVSVPFTEADGSARRGPSTPMEREAIARRMAAMDYHDDNYGGKHWEQWQTISLHLLNLYEFSEDTDRETSSAYVRLCVLKDELRDANPNGPRVTVNHCKEVFRILNLPVTGEWDRRGHGGVRGPYVYGCVKKSGAPVSRR